jgi:hypothetical protein
MKILHLLRLEEILNADLALDAVQHIRNPERMGTFLAIRREG